MHLIRMNKTELIKISYRSIPVEKSRSTESIVKSFYVVKLSFNESELDTKQESSSYLLLYICMLQIGTLKSGLNNLTT